MPTAIFYSPCCGVAENLMKETQNQLAGWQCLTYDKSLDFKYNPNTVKANMIVISNTDTILGQFDGAPGDKMIEFLATRLGSNQPIIIMIMQDKVTTAHTQIGGICMHKVWTEEAAARLPALYKKAAAGYAPA